MTFRRFAAAAASLLVAATLLAACTSHDNGGAIKLSPTTTTAGATAGTTPTSAATAGPSPALFTDLPKEIQDAKQVKVGSDISHPPFEFFPQGSQDAQGLDVDLAAALGAKLGVKFQFQNTPAAGAIAELTAKRFDVVMSAMTDTANTRDKGVDFVDYFNTQAAPYGIAVRKDDTQLRDSIVAALKAIIADGTYDQILAKWNVTQLALKTAQVNGGS